MALIRKTYTFLDNSSFLLLYKSLVRPHLEYANQIWRPHLKKHIHAIENVQRRATRLLPGMQNLTYEERLKKLKLPTLEYRRIRGDMIEAFKITSGHYKHQAIENFLPLNNRTSRGHSKKLHHQQASIDLRKYSFTHRIVETWNSLPSEVINAPSIQAFERRLDKYWLHHHQFSPYRPPQ
jgi:ribonucleases P/MRP protein subunit RPP40